MRSCDYPSKKVSLSVFVHQLIYAMKHSKVTVDQHPLNNTITIFHKKSKWYYVVNLGNASSRRIGDIVLANWMNGNFPPSLNECKYI